MPSHHRKREFPPSDLRHPESRHHQVQSLPHRRPPDRRFLPDRLHLRHPASWVSSSCPANSSSTNIRVAVIDPLGFYTNPCFRSRALHNTTRSRRSQSSWILLPPCLPAAEHRWNWKNRVYLSGIADRDIRSVDRSGGGRHHCQYKCRCDRTTAAAASLTALLRPSLVFSISPSEAGAADSGSAVQSIVLLMTGNFRPQHRSLYFPRCNNQIRQFPVPVHYCFRNKSVPGSNAIYHYNTGYAFVGKILELLSVNKYMLNLSS